MLSRMIQDNVPESAVSPMIDHVEAARGTLDKMRTLMLVHMRQVLTASQRARFESLHAEWQIELQQAGVDRQREEQKRKEDSQKANQKPHQKPASDRRGRPGV
jgi:Spy/CpxP family protein refolding chaperone